MDKDFKKKILDIKYPEVTTNQTCATLWAILSYRQNALPWLYNYFVQIIGRTQYKSGFLEFDEADIIWKECPFFDFQLLDRKLLYSISKQRPIVEIVKDAIDQDYYLYTMLNQFYNPFTPEFNEIHSGHHTLIYGYDEAEKTLNVADFYHDAKYDITKQIPFSLFESAFNDIYSCTNSDWFVWGSGRGIFDICYYLVFIRYRDFEYTFDLELFSRLLNDFLQSRNTVQRYEEEKVRVGRECVYGLQAYEYLKNCIQYIEESKQYNWNTVKSLHLIVDHKKAMILRIHFMIEKKYINNGVSILNEYKKIEALSQIILNVFFKYHLTKDNCLLIELSSLFDQLIEKEKMAINMILDNIIYSSVEKSKITNSDVERFKREILHP
jgi:hypothetical protein